MQKNNSPLSLYSKRSFDLFFSLFGLFVFSPIIVIAWIIASYETKSNGMFVQRRIGYLGIEFNVFKIKTMKQIANVDTTITTNKDARITKSGVFFRKTKIDELPQLWNVLIGDMSFVGPRPDVAGYADLLMGDDRIILTIKPGITGPASIKYKDEEKILAQFDDPQSYNDSVIWPDKVSINKDYILNYSFKNDLKYILKTIKGDM